MGAATLIRDPALVAELRDVVRSGRELCVVVLRVQGGGAKDWYIVESERELETVLDRIPPVGPHGYSDRIELFATGEFPYRTTDDDEWLRARAIEVIETAGEVVLACRQAGDPELRDVDGADGQSIGVLDAWFSEPHKGERLAGPHPFRHADGDPGVWVAWNPNTNGEVRPGAY